MKDPRRRQAREQALDLMREGFSEKAPHLFDAVCDIICERHKADAIHGPNSAVRLRSGFAALAVLVEEVGELATAMMTLAHTDAKMEPDFYVDVLHNLRYEAVQVAASACAIVE